MGIHSKDDGVVHAAEAKPSRLIAAENRSGLAIAHARQLYGRFAPDPALTEDSDVDFCCRHLAIPYSAKNGMMALAATTHADGLAAIREIPAAQSIEDIVLVPKAQMLAHLQARFGHILTDRAVNGLYQSQPNLSARSPISTGIKALLGALAFCALASIAGLGGYSASIFWTFIAVYLLATTTLRLILVGSALRKQRPTATSLPAKLPVVTLLIPVYQEADSMPALLQSLERLRYPKQQLDVKILVESDDYETRKELASLPDFPWCEILVVPKSSPRTKPKALNYALPFARGAIVGIFDAEDCPDPDQIIDAIIALHNAPADVICAQARLSHYNPEESVLTRCVALEYAMWFDALLLGLSRLNLPVPLGGTSLYVKTRELRELGGWDPDNVTEDADLGLRIARAGYRATVFNSITYEEATTSAGAWVRQRSRWIKGFMVTWIVHMKNPVRLVKELGALPTLAINIMLLDGFLAFLIQPFIFIALLASVFGVPLSWMDHWDTPFAMATYAILLIGQIAIIGAAFVQSRKRFGIRVAIFAPLLCLYWMMGGIAAFRAASQLFGRCQFWDKTTHCVSPIARSRREEAIGTLRDSI